MNPEVPCGNLDKSKSRAREISQYRNARDDAHTKLCLLAQLATKATGADIAGVSLVYCTYIIVITSDGLPAQRYDCTDSICARAVGSHEAFFEISDLDANPEFPATQFPAMRHYAAVTLCNGHGYVLGTLWVMAALPGSLETSQSFLLKGLGKLVVDVLEMHFRDPATGMHNRAALVHLTQDIMALPLVSEILVGYINFAGFRRINEIFGRDIGDWLLRAIANRLQSWGDQDELVGHFGGDRFGFTLRGSRSSERLLSLQQAIDEPFRLPDGRLHLMYARIGLARDSLPTQHDSGMLFEMAETASSTISAMHGRSVIYEYTNVLRDRSRVLQALQALLDGCPHAGKLCVYYQPQVNFFDDRLIGFEALARWSHPELGQVPPQTFVELAGSTGRCYELDMRIVRLVCEMMGKWNDAGLLCVPISLNLSRISLVNPRLPEEIAMLLLENCLPGEMLEIEITEGQLLEHPSALQKCIDALKVLGLRIAIDDFGTGYSNLDAIASLHFDRLKVDRRFVHGVADSETTASLFLLIQAVAQVSGAELLCEGLEREEDLEWLRRHQAFCVQGWYFGSAQPAEHAERMLRCWKSRLLEQDN